MDIATRLLMMGADMVEMAVEYTAGSSYDPVEGYSGVSENFASGSRLIMDKGPITVGLDEVEVVEAAAHSSSLRFEIRVAGEAGGSLAFMMEERCLVGMDGGMTDITESRRYSFFNWMSLLG